MLQGLRCLYWDMHFIHVDRTRRCTLGRDTVNVSVSFSLVNHTTQTRAHTPKNHLFNRPENWSLMHDLPLKQVDQHHPSLSSGWTSRQLAATIWDLPTQWKIYSYASQTLMFLIVHLKMAETILIVTTMLQFSSPALVIVSLLKLS